MELERIKHIVSCEGDMERLCWFVNDNLGATDDMKRLFVESLLPYLMNTEDARPVDGKHAQIWLGYPFRHTLFMSMCSTHLVEGTDYVLGDGFVHSMSITAFKQLAIFANTRRGEKVCGYLDDLEKLLARYSSVEMQIKQLKQNKIQEIWGCHPST
jgi:hypothetical protein